MYHMLMERRTSIAEELAALTPEELDVLEKALKVLSLKKRLEKQQIRLKGKMTAMMARVLGGAGINIQALVGPHAIQGDNRRSLQRRPEMAQWRMSARKRAAD
jgi:hypothetical protein